MLDNLNLTHMTGRVYDQLIGQFASADPFIDGMDSTQGWNRYAYVHNSPLRFTDPSGFNAQERPHVLRINGIEIENVVVEGSRGGGAGLASLVFGMQGNISRGVGGGEHGGGGGGGTIETVTVTASRIRPKGPFVRGAAASDSTEPTPHAIPCNSVHWQGEPGITDILANGSEAVDRAIRSAADAASNAPALSGYYTSVFKRIDMTTDTAEALGDAVTGDRARAVAGVIDTAMDFGGDTFGTFAAGAAWDQLGGARGAVDTYRVVNPLIGVTPMAALFEAQRALRCQRGPGGQ